MCYFTHENCFVVLYLCWFLSLHAICRSGKLVEAHCYGKGMAGQFLSEHIAVKQVEVKTFQPQRLSSVTILYCTILKYLYCTLQSVLLAKASNNVSSDVEHLYCYVKCLTSLLNFAGKMVKKCLSFALVSGVCLQVLVSYTLHMAAIYSANDIIKS